MKNNNVMYLAVLRVEYEGIYESDMKLCKTKPEAEKHIVYLKKKYGAIQWPEEFDIIELPIHD